jgi:hypothetical protein
MMERPGMECVLRFGVLRQAFHSRLSPLALTEHAPRLSTSLPPKVTARISGRSRLPSHASQNCGLMNALSRLRVNSLRSRRRAAPCSATRPRTDASPCSPCPRARIETSFPSRPSRAAARALEVLRQIFVRRFEILAKVRRHRPQHRLVVNDHPLAAAPPRQHRALLQRFVRSGTTSAVVKNHLLAQPMTHRTRAVR